MKTEFFRLQNLYLKNKSKSNKRYGYICKKDLSFYVHMQEDARLLQNVINMSDVSCEPLISASLITPENKNTHSGMCFGLILNAPISNIASISDSNHASGFGKNFDSFFQLVYDDEQNVRNQYAALVKEYLSMFYGEIGDETYCELYDSISRYKYQGQIKNDKFFNIGGNIFYGKHIKDAVNFANSHILTVARNNNNSSNEINIYQPQTEAIIAKVDSIKQVPDEIIQLASCNNLPIIIFGNN